MMRVFIILAVLAISSTNARVAVYVNEISNEITNPTKQHSDIHIEVVDTSNSTDKGSHVSTTPDHDITDNTIENEPSINNNKVDNGVALLLSPFIKEGRVDEARNACRVDPKIFLGLESYSGFLTVNETYNSNLYFWYFPIKNKPVDSSPWIVWLQGGPGASSMIGLFDEIGPFKFVSEELVPNPYTWHTNHSLLFIDNPVGTGFSFTDHEDGITTDMETYSRHLYTALHQFLQIFPELRRAPLYVAGESYAGKYAPSLGIEIHEHKGLPGHDVNLEGFIMGNAYIDPSMIYQMTKPFYYFGLLDKQQLDLLQPISDKFQLHVANNNSRKAKLYWNRLITVVLQLTHQKHAYNFLSDEVNAGSYVSFLYKDDVKRALHVGDIHFEFVNVTVNSKLSADFLSSTKHKFEKLLEEKYRVLTYCGQLDQMLPCVMTSDHFRTWEWQASQDFLRAPRYPYIYNSKLAGYIKTGGHLTEVIVRGAGHMAPIDAPGPVHSLVTRWTHDAPIVRMADIIEQTIARQGVNSSVFVYL